MQQTDEALLAAIAQGEADGVEDAQAVVDGFREVVEKWRGIVAETGDDKAAYAAALDAYLPSPCRPAPYAAARHASPRMPR